jgi:hypothetical protein
LDLAAAADGTGAVIFLKERGSMATVRVQPSGLNTPMMRRSNRSYISARSEITMNWQLTVNFCWEMLLLMIYMNKQCNLSGLQYEVSENCCQYCKQHNNVQK